jgi:phosphatidylserine/phosphatidylglycerophosphate/cardiolipin synthase-like enzyme
MGLRYARARVGAWSDAFRAGRNAELDMEGRVKKVDRTHTKGMIVDSKDVLIGSHNWSGPGVSTDRDASLIFFDNPEIAAYYKEAFDIDWQRSSEPRSRETPEIEMCLATTEAPPPGL